jgi:hypothetical protein
VRVLACIASCTASSWEPAAAGGKGRLRSNAAVARMKLGIFLSSFFSGERGFPLSYLDRSGSSRH